MIAAQRLKSKADQISLLQLKKFSVLLINSRTKILKRFQYMI